MQLFDCVLCFGDVLFAGVQLSFAALQTVQFLVKKLFTLEDTALAALQFIAAVAAFFIKIRTLAVNFFFGFENGLLFQSLCPLLGIVNHLVNSVLGPCDLTLGDIAPVIISAGAAKPQACNANEDANNYILH